METEIFRVIRQIHEEQGVSILLVEQNARRALAIAHRGYVVESGRIALAGSAAQLADNPDIKQFYLGVGESGHRRSYRDANKRRKG
jgi:branched-chain amino acid transport system ATP-binding protein